MYNCLTAFPVCRKSGVTSTLDNRHFFSYTIDNKVGRATGEQMEQSHLRSSFIQSSVPCEATRALSFTVFSSMNLILYMTWDETTFVFARKSAVGTHSTVFLNSPSS